MDSAKLDELERLAKAATPGPWSRYADIHIKTMDGWGIGFIHHPLRSREETVNNAAYIVAACNAVPELIARVRELERQREFFLKALNDNRLCPNGGCFHDGSDLDEWDCTSYDNRECWINAAKEAGK